MVKEIHPLTIWGGAVAVTLFGKELESNRVQNSSIVLFFCCDSKDFLSAD